MSEGDIEYGICAVCGERHNLNRTYFHYDVPCGCHVNGHFEVIRHCSDCTPAEPSHTRITIKTDLLKELIEAKNSNKTFTIKT